MARPSHSEYIGGTVALGKTVPQGGTFTTTNHYAQIDRASHYAEDPGSTITQSTLTVVDSVTDGNEEIAQVDTNQFEIGLSVGPQDAVEVQGVEVGEKEDLDQTV